MIKKVVQDVILPNKKSIRHIPLPVGRRQQSVERVEIEPSSPVRQKGRRWNGRLLRWLIIIGSLAILVGVFFAVSWLFSSATVTITQKQITAPLDTLLQCDTKGKADLAYTVVTATSTASLIVATSREEDVQKKASGQIVIYNNYSSESQRLIKNTRFEAADGRIYRIDTSIIVPGQRVEGGKKVPGSVTAVVYADVAGPEYNLLLSSLKGDFTIPGFKGSPRYEAFYARQKTDIVGGFVGRERVVDRSVREMSENRLKTRLGEELWNSLRSSLPSSYVIFRTIYETEFTVVSRDNPKGDGVEVSVTAVGRTAAFDKVSLSSTVAKRSIKDYDSSEPVLIANLDEVGITSVGTDKGKAWDEIPLVLNLKGNARFVWQFDKEEFKNNLSGRSKKDTDSIMRRYKAIERAEVVIKPPWLSKYPSNTARIHIISKTHSSDQDSN